MHRTDKSYHAPHRVSDNDHFDNRLIFGDNLLALKALEQEFTGKIKCIYIDPPYNTGSAFTHYDDGIEHSLWLSLIRDRLELLHRLLSEGGTLWINLDDNEAHYCKVLSDEVFGRDNFVATVIWERTTSARNDAKYFPVTGEEVWPRKSRVWAYGKETHAKHLQEDLLWWGKTGNYSLPKLKKFLNDASATLAPRTLWLTSEVDQTRTHEQPGRKLRIFFQSIRLTLLNRSD